MRKNWAGSLTLTSPPAEEREGSAAAAVEDVVSEEHCPVVGGRRDGLCGVHRWTTPQDVVARLVSTVAAICCSLVSNRLGENLPKALGSPPDRAMEKQKPTLDGPSLL
ncbi:hypothetical protein OsI_20174 [Oryza sativa Indica Group]|uniref:Uncharacterized protein n=2 Tax=Oryza TaxID=4527 RepID=A0A0E0PND2_ORYRU|nr:hypothetical protein OsI_20174 [Oryza sativa Indica Group]